MMWKGLIADFGHLASAQAGHEDTEFALALVQATAPQQDLNFIRWQKKLNMGNYGHARIEALGIGERISWKARPVESRPQLRS